MHFFLQNKVCDTIKLREKIIAFCVDLYALKEFYVFSSDVKCSGSLSHSHFEYNNMISHNKKKKQTTNMIFATLNLQTEPH